MSEWSPESYERFRDNDPDHDPEEHLKPTMTNRGFQHMNPIPGTSGYNMELLPDGTPDWDTMTPRDHGHVRVYESSSADYAALWINVEDGDGKEATLHITIERAALLRDQLDYLIKNHYQNG